MLEMTAETQRRAVFSLTAETLLADNVRGRIRLVNWRECMKKPPCLVNGGKQGER